MAYDFHYTPTGTGVISGKEVLEQTEDAINDLGNTAISGVQEALDKAEQALTNSENAVDDAQTALNTANNAEGVAIQAQTDVGNLSGTVTNIGNRVTTAEGNISNLQGRMTTAEGNISNLQGRMTTAETNIGNLQTAVSTAQATANSAQQTATTARQQSYVFRYSSTALTPSSTNSNALLDNTDNLKIGDKVIDSSGVLFSITAIDTANSTFTIGTALVDLANDSDVVHKSGAETISGNKTFSSNVNVYNSDSATDTANIILKNSKAERGSTTNIGEQNIFFLDKDNAQIGNIKCEVDANGVSMLNILCVNSSNSSAGIRLRRTSTGTFLQPTFNNGCNLGTSGYRWYDVQTRAVNSLEPSSLSLPVFPSSSSSIDISSYITDMTGAANSYTPPANGYITFVATGSQVQIFSDYGLQSKFSIQSGSIIRGYHPVLKNEPIKIYMLGTSVESFRFIPCQGNI